jgi:hypothetical protein
MPAGFQKPGVATEGGQCNFLQIRACATRWHLINVKVLRDEKKKIAYLKKNNLRGL